MLLTATRCRCKTSGLEFDLDVEWLESLWERQRGLCFWYQIEMSPKDVKRNPLQPSIDRIDGSKGYLKSNVVLTCAAANLGRNSTPADEFSVFASKLRESFIAGQSQKAE
jgi:hypothetical protein